MLLIDFLYSVPSFWLFMIIAVTTIGLTLIYTFLVSYRIDINYRYRENAAIICISGIISLIYAILVGFTVLYELDTFDKAVQAETIEGKAVFDIYRDALLMPDAASAEIRKQVVSYAKYVVETEWPLMRQGKSLDNTALTYLNNISGVLNSFRTTNNLKPSQTTTLDELYTLNSSLLDDHEERAAKVHLSLIPGMWLVLLIGTFLTISMTTILGMEFRLHILCVAAASLMISAVIYLLVTIDRPYRGDFSVQPDTLIATLKFISWQKNNDVTLPDIHYLENLTPTKKHTTIFKLKKN